VNGVSRATVTLEGHVAQVDYDPRRCSVDDLIAAVAKAKDQSTPMTFSATVKK
jgi:copper chaperone CopZ